MATSNKIRRPRHRKHRRHSPKHDAFLAAMETKWSGQETAINITAVGSNALDLASTPPTPGPYSLRGAPPPELRDFDRFWLQVGGSDVCTVFRSRADLANNRNPFTIASWDLSPDIVSLETDAETLDTTASVDTIATLSTLGTCASLGTPVTITAVTAGADTLTIVGHGYSVNQGPFYIASSGDIPAGLAATTPYWIKTVPTADTFTVSATLGGALIDITDAGTGTITWIPVNVDVSLDTLEVAAHGLATGDGPFYVSTSGGLPTGLAATTYYWVNVVTANRFALATTLANAMDGVVVNLTGIGTGTQTVSRVAVDTTLDKLRSVAHGLTTGTLVRLTTDGALPTGLAAATNYWIIALTADYLQFASSLANSASGTAINLTAVGSGTTTISRCRIDTTLDTYVFPSPHGWVTGDGPVRATTGTTLPTGVSAATDYYIIRVDDNTVKLATTEANALAGTPVDITAIGAGTQTLTMSGVDVTENGLHVASHGMQTADGPVRVSTAGVLPAGLAAATDYWVIRMDANHFKLATSAVNAAAGTAVNITDIGTGTHQLVRALTAGLDLTAAGLLEWLEQGVDPETMRLGSTADVATIFDT